MKLKTLLLLSCLTLSLSTLQAQDKRTWRQILGSSSSESEKAGNKKENASNSNASDSSVDPQSLLELIDIPTTNILDYGAYGLNFRFYERGGVISRLSFGVFRRLNIGVSWDNEKVIGSEDAQTNVPALQVKVRAFDGSANLPSFSIGYDGQGRFFDRSKDEYFESERGMFIVLGRELFCEGLEVHAGSNISRFREGKVYGFLGFSYNIDDRLVLFTEYDNIRVGPQNRWNIGVKLFPVSWLSLDFAFRKVGSNQDKERILRINYVGKF